jgi:hypothetical protein
MASFYDRTVKATKRKNNHEDWLYTRIVKDYFYSNSKYKQAIIDAIDSGKFKSILPDLKFLHYGERTKKHACGNLKTAVDRYNQTFANHDKPLLEYIETPAWTNDQLREWHKKYPGKAYPGLGCGKCFVEAHWSKQAVNQKAEMYKKSKKSSKFDV